MAEPITASVLLTAAAKKIIDSLTSKASGQTTDALRSTLKGDPTEKAFKSSITKEVQRYAPADRLQLAKPLLAEDGILTDPDVAKELACLIEFEREPDAALIGKRWKAAIPDASERVDSPRRRISC
jgi:hypothetical protein